MESGLEPFVRAFAASRPGFDWNPEWRRQYIGMIDIDGGRELIAEFYCDEDPLDVLRLSQDPNYWKCNWLGVTGGGDCYFSVIYDLEINEFVAVIPN